VSGIATWVVWGVEVWIGGESDVRGSFFVVRHSAGHWVLRRIRLTWLCGGNDRWVLGDLDVRASCVDLVFASWVTRVHVRHGWPLPDPVECHGAFGHVFGDLEVHFAP
jgi:hypothetical protein